MWSIKTINAIAPVWKDNLAEDQYAVSPDFADPDAIIVRSASLHEMEIPASLKCVARAGAGYNNIPTDKMAEAGVVVFNTPGANANAVKELAITAMLLSSRKIAEGIAWCATLSDGEKTVAQQVESGKSQFIGPELYGKTLGVVGLGAVGLQVANAGVALGMTVMGYDPFISIDNAWRLSRAVTHTLTIDEILSKCDYISVHVPLMDSTKNMFNADTIAKMKDGAVLLNLSRGGLVDNEAMKAAIAAGKIRKYVTDFPDASLVGVPGVLAMPHLGASTPESEDNCVTMASAQIRDYLETGSIVNSVNFPACVLTRPTTNRVCVLHQNVPNVLTSVTQIFSSMGINIENMTNKSRGTHAYTVLDLNGDITEDALRSISDMETVYSVRAIRP